MLGPNWPRPEYHSDRGLLHSQATRPGVSLVAVLLGSVEPGGKLGTARQDRGVQLALTRQPGFNPGKLFLPVLEARLIPGKSSVDLGDFFPEGLRPTFKLFSIMSAHGRDS